MTEYAPPYRYPDSMTWSYGPLTSKPWPFADQSWRVTSDEGETAKRLTLLEVQVKELAQLVADLQQEQVGG